jgi:hypothetical protein
MIALIDRIRMLDNDLSRLEQKINTEIELQRGTQGSPHFVPVPEPTQPNEKPNTVQPHTS